MSEDLEQRVTHVEARLDQMARELGRAREDAGAARTLAAGADRESAETRQVLRGQTSLIQALRDTQLEQSAALGDHRQVLGALVTETASNSSRLNALATDTASNSSRLDALEAGQQQIVGLLDEVLSRLPEPPAA